MTALSTIRTDVRNRLVETTADFFTDAELRTWINYAYRDFIKKSEWLERTKAVAMVANQFDYSLPSDILKVAGIWWKDQYKLDPKDLEEFHQYVGAGFPSSGTPPKIYRLFPWYGKIRIHPRPATASDSSTVSGAHNTSVTTIALADATNFPNSGYAIINSSEQIFYYAKSGNNLTQVVRGDGGTTAGTYTGGETVSVAPLLVYYTYLPADLSGDSDTVATPDQYDKIYSDYAFGMALSKAGKQQEAKFWLTQAEDGMKHALEERTKQQRDQNHFIKDADWHTWTL